jgi:hypothetical protein
MDPISKEFVARLESLEQRVPVVQFRKGERKVDIAAEFIRKFKQEEGVLFIGKAQEKTRVFRTERRRNPKTGVAYPWLVRSHRLGQPLLHLRSGPRLRAVLSEVLHLFSLHGEALPQWPRMAQTATQATRHRL